MKAGMAQGDDCMLPGGLSGRVSVHGDIDDISIVGNGIRRINATNVPRPPVATALHRSC